MDTRNLSYFATRREQIRKEEERIVEEKLTFIKEVALNFGGRFDFKSSCAINFVGNDGISEVVGVIAPNEEEYPYAVLKNGSIVPEISWSNDTVENMFMAVYSELILQI